MAHFCKLSLKKNTLPHVRQLEFEATLRGTDWHTHHQRSLKSWSSSGRAASAVDGHALTSDRVRSTLWRGIPLAAHAGVKGLNSAGSAGSAAVWLLRQGLPRCSARPLAYGCW
jgi:hypothetical protein